MLYDILVRTIAAVPSELVSSEVATLSVWWMEMLLCEDSAVSIGYA